MQVSIGHVRAWGPAPASSAAPESVRAYLNLVGVPGGPGGAAGPQPNRDFQDLWMRFVSSVSQFGRQTSVSELMEAGLGSALASRDMWQVVDRVATAELGGAVNSTRRRTLAESGGAIVEMLARRASTGDTAAGTPADFDLVQACERWLAASTVSDDDVREFAQAQEAQQQIDAWSGALHAALGTEPGRVRLFSGPSGTGKTLAAHWLASSLGRELQRVDLAAVTSKYIGETEKNLARVFDAAQRNDAVLLFDEADALFGKRSEVHDAQDRYANLPTDELLRRVEGYDGLVVVTSNLASNIDAAALLRLKTIVFPLPPR